MTLYEFFWGWGRQVAFSECFMLHHCIKLLLTNRARARASRRKPIQVHLENKLLATCRKSKKLTNLLPFTSNIASSSISISLVWLLYLCECKSIFARLLQYLEHLIPGLKLFIIKCCMLSSCRASFPNHFSPVVCSSQNSPASRHQVGGGHVQSCCTFHRMNQMFLFLVYLNKI